MQPSPGEPAKFKRIVSDTRRWSSALVKFTVLGLEGHPERTYIACEKIVGGRSISAGGFQRFNLRLRDWPHLKRLIEDELANQHGWALEASGLHVVPTTDNDLDRFIAEHPGLLEKLLDLPHIGSLSRESFEALNRLSMQVYVVQTKHLDTILDRLATASERDFVNFAALLRELRVGQIATLANLIRQKLKIIGLFRTLTTSDATIRSRDP